MEWRKMKKIFLAIVILLSCTAVTACSNSDNKTTSTSDTQKKEITIDIDKLGEQLVNEVDFSDEMSAIALEMAQNVFDVADLGITEQAVYMSAGATADVIAIFKCSDDNMSELKNRIDSWISDIKETNTNYAPEEIPKLEDCVKRQEGDYYMVVISGDNDKVNEIIDEYIK